MIEIVAKVVQTFGRWRAPSHRSERRQGLPSAAPFSGAHGDNGTVIDRTVLRRLHGHATKGLCASILFLSLTGCVPPDVSDDAAKETASPSPATATSDVPADKRNERSPARDSRASATPLPDLPKGRTRTMLRAGGLYDITFDDLEFAIEPDAEFRRSLLTETAESLDGKPVIIRGFMLDSSIFARKGITQFVLIRDNQICCFGPGAKIFHNIMVDMKPGTSAEFTDRPVTAKGVFKIEPWVSPSDGKTYSVFHLEAESVKKIH